jgi:hypothetical protein
MEILSGLGKRLQQALRTLTLTYADLTAYGQAYTRPQSAALRRYGQTATDKAVLRTASQRRGAPGLAILETLITRQWGSLWPQPVHARMEILSGLGKRSNASN